MNVREDYLQLDAYGYERSVAHWSNIPSTFLITIPAAAGFPESERVALDLACGQGRNTAMLAARGYVVDAIDSSPLAIRTLTALGMPNIRAQVGDLLDVVTSARDRSFAVVLCNHGLQYVSSLAVFDAAVDRMLRLLVDDGILALAFFTEPADLHPEYVRDGALLVPREHLLRRLLERDDVEVIFFQHEVMHDDHDHGPHTHAVERIIVRRSPSSGVRR